MSFFRRGLTPAAAFMCVVVSACSESPTATISTLNSAPGNSLQMIRCNVDAVAETMACAPAFNTPLGIAADLLVGGSNNATYVTLASTNVVTTATVSVTADVTVKNLTAQPFSTTTGLVASATGVNVFFTVLPNNGVTVTNPTGINGTFTTTGQTFFQYTGADLNVGTDLVSGILVPQETSATKNWQFALNGQTTFAFTVAVSTPVPAQGGVLRITTPAQVPGVAVKDIYAAAANDIFAIPSGGAVSTVQHFDGNNWNTTIAIAGSSNAWNAIHGNSGTDVYLVGNTQAIRHYTGTTFGTETVTTTGNLLGVWANATTAYAVSSLGKVVRRSGGSWTEMSSLPAAAQLNAVWGFSDTDVFVVGNAGVVSHWDGTSWVNIISNNLIDYKGVWGTSATNVWIVGTAGTIKQCTYVNPTLSCTVPTASNTSSALTDISGTSPSSMFAVGNAVTAYGVTNGTIMRFNGTAWSTMASGVTTALTNVYALTDTDMYVAGATGSVFRRGVR